MILVVLSYVLHVNCTEVTEISLCSLHYRLKSILYRNYAGNSYGGACNIVGTNFHCGSMVDYYSLQLPPYFDRSHSLGAVLMHSYTAARRTARLDFGSLYV